MTASADRANRDVAIGRGLQRRRCACGTSGATAAAMAANAARSTLPERARHSRSRLRRARGFQFLGAFGKPRIVGAKPRGQLGKTGVRS